jgi:hypothetical protein
MWTYSQSTGELTDPEGKIIATGYAGHGNGVNNPAMQNVPDVGPLPQGKYTISEASTQPRLGPHAMHLMPDPNDEEIGRSGFYIHGDNSKGNHSASLGCIVLAHDVRQMLSESPDRRLEVVA